MLPLGIVATFISGLAVGVGVEAAVGTAAGGTGAATGVGAPDVCSFLGLATSLAGAALLVEETLFSEEVASDFCGGFCVSLELLSPDFTCEVTEGILGAAALLLLLVELDTVVGAEAVGSTDGCEPLVFVIVKLGLTVVVVEAVTAVPTADGRVWSVVCGAADDAGDTVTEAEPAALVGLVPDKSTLLFWSGLLTGVTETEEERWEVISNLTCDMLFPETNKINALQ